MRVWQLDDVSRSLPQSTLISRYNEQQRSRNSSCSRHIQRSVPDRWYTALPLKCKGKDTGLAIALDRTCVRLIPRLLAINQQIYM